jgi:hypothetical protein
MPPPPRVASASVEAGRSQWHVEPAENSPTAGAAQSDEQQLVSRWRAEPTEAASPMTTSPSATPGPSAASLSAAPPSTVDPATGADQSAGVPTATPEAAAPPASPSSSAPGRGPGPESRTHQTDAGAPRTSGSAGDSKPAHAPARSALDDDGRSGASHAPPVGDDAKDSGSDRKDNARASPPGQATSNGNGNGAAHSASDPKDHGAAASPGSGEPNGTGAAQSGSDSKDNAKPPPPGQAASNGNGAAQAGSASKGNATITDAQAGRNGDHTSSPPSTQAPVKPQAQTAPSPPTPVATASGPTRPSTPAAVPGSTQKSKGNGG